MKRGAHTHTHMKARYRVIEYGNGYAVRDSHTGNEHWLSDGVDSVFTKTGRAMWPGTERMRRAWERSLNATPDETAEAYFSR